MEDHMEYMHRGRRRRRGSCASPAKTLRKRLAVLGALPALLLGGCLVEHVRQWGNVDEAIAVVGPANGSDVTGIVRFLQLQDGVKVIAELEGLEPGSTHAMHVHAYGDCSSPDARSAGGHYNPEGHPHGLPSADKRHAGDLGNVVADANGRVEHDLTVHNLSVAELNNPVIGRAVVIHAEADTGEQPTGEAGARIGCGVIGVANPSPSVN